MKTSTIRILLLLLFIFSFQKNYAQCGNGTLSLTSQQSVNDFSQNFPSCTEFTGNISISGADITNLNSLSGLTAIKGSLTIFDNPTLTSLQGLQNLTSIGSGSAGDLIILNNASLANLSSLQNLTSVNRSLEIHNNDALMNLDGLSQLTNIGYGHLSVIDNNNLANIDALQNLASVGTLGNDIGILIYNNPVLLKLTGLSSLATIKGGLIIRSNASLIDVSDINITNMITGAGNGLIIENNNALQNLDGLSIQQLKGNSQFINNQNLESINLTIIDNSEVTTLLIDNNPELNNILGLEKITKVTANFNALRVMNNDSLTNIDGLSHIISVLGNVIIKDNAVLENLDGLSSFTTSANSSALEISNNSLLKNIDGLSHLTKIGKILILDNPQLLNIDGLVSVAQLSSTSEVRQLSIYNNQNLENIQGIRNIAQTSIGNLLISSNPKVSVCNLPNICEYLATAKPRSINTNNNGCNTIAEVISACATLATESTKSNEIKIFPNPTSDVINLSKITNKIEITDQNGKSIKTLFNVEKIDIRQLIPGVYYFKITDGQNQDIKKIIKL